MDSTASTLALPKLMFLAGVPATGKTHFGDWLSREHGAIHLDFDDAQLRLKHDDLVLLARDLVECGRFAMVSWGYPADDSTVPSRYAQAGFEPWWFDSSAAAARSAFKKRGGDIDDFERQMAAIERNRNDIRRLFAPRIITTLMNDGTRLEPTDIIARMAAVRTAK